MLLAEWPSNKTDQEGLNNQDHFDVRNVQPYSIKTVSLPDNMLAGCMEVSAVDNGPFCALCALRKYS